MHYRDFPSSHSSIVAAVEDGNSYSSSAECEVLSVIKILNAQSIAPIEIHRQLCQQSFPADFSRLVAQNCHGASVVQKTVCQLGAKATDTRTQSKPHVVSTDNFGPSVLKQIPVQSASAFSECQRGGVECYSCSNPRRQTSTTQGHKSWFHGTTNASVPEVNMLKNSSVPINLSIKLSFVSVKHHRKSYFMDALRKISLAVETYGSIVTYESFIASVVKSLAVDGSPGRIEYNRI